MLDLVQIGKKLTELRQKKELTQDELAETLFVSHQAVSKWERGAALPSIDNLCFLMEMYSASLEELLCLETKVLEGDVTSLLNEHNREYVIHEVVEGKIKDVSLPDIIHKLSEDERRYAIYLLIDQKKCISEILWPRLSLDERQMIIHKYKAGHRTLKVNSLTHLMSYVEIKNLKEKLK